MMKAHEHRMVRHPPTTVANIDANFHNLATYQVTKVQYQLDSDTSARDAEEKAAREALYLDKPTRAALIERTEAAPCSQPNSYPLAELLCDPYAGLIATTGAAPIGPTTMAFKVTPKMPNILGATEGSPITLLLRLKYPTYLVYPLTKKDPPEQANSYTLINYIFEGQGEYNACTSSIYETQLVKYPGAIKRLPVVPIGGEPIMMLPLPPNREIIEKLALIAHPRHHSLLQHRLTVARRLMVDPKAIPLSAIHAIVENAPLSHGDKKIIAAMAPPRAPSLDEIKAALEWPIGEPNTKPSSCTHYSISPKKCMLCSYQENPKQAIFSKKSIETSFLLEGLMDCHGLKKYKPTTTTISTGNGVYLCTNTVGVFVWSDSGAIKSHEEERTAYRALWRAKECETLVVIVVTSEALGHLYKVVNSSAPLESATWTQIIVKICRIVCVHLDRQPSKIIDIVTV